MAMSIIRIRWMEIRSDNTALLACAFETKADVGSDRRAVRSKTHIVRPRTSCYLL